MLEPIVELSIDDKTYQLKPTFRTLGKVENALGKSILKVIADGVVGSNARGILQDEMFLILKTAIVSADNKIDDEELESFILKNRIKAYEVVTEFLYKSFRPQEFSLSGETGGETDEAKK